ncbi:MAG: DUF5723 family protein [Flavobacteriales bacterium]|jgi:hypothetical protein|nr:DUF5723 family protein [Flavobacteriales bacterium]
MKLFVLIISFVVSVLYFNAQQDLGLYFLDNVQQVQQTNPAIRPKFDLNIGVPALSGIYLNHFNTIFTPKALFKNADPTIVIPTNGTLPELRTQHLKRMWTNRNYVGLHTKLDLIHFGFKLRENYVNFSITENASARITLPGDLLEFPIRITEDYTQFDGNTQSFKGFNLHLNHYREYGVGITHPINDYMNVGVKLKYLYGMENIDTRKNTITATYTSENQTITTDGEIKINSSGIANAENQSVMGYLFGKKNRGLGLDLGIETEFDEKTKFSLSITDVGFIRWKSDNRNLIASNGEIGDQVLDLSEQIFSSPTYSQDSIDAILNDISNDINGDGIYSFNDKKYTTLLISQIYFGGIRELYSTPKLSGKASALLHAEVYNWRIRPSLTLAYYQTVGRWLQLTASYSYINRDFKNLGAGFTAKLGPFQYYLLVDNLLPLRRTKIQVGDDSDAIPYPKFSKTLHLKTGINLVFSKRKSNNKYFRDSKGNPTKFRKDPYSCPQM